MNTLSLLAIRSALSMGSRLFPSLIGDFIFRMFCTPPPPRALSERAQAALASAQPLSVKAESLSFAGYLWSDSSTERVNPLLLLVHGWSGRAADFSPLVEPLRHAGFDLAAFDAPAHGGSAGKQLHIAQYGRALLAGSQLLQDRGYVIRGIVGHSLGSMVSAYTAAGTSPLPHGLAGIERLALIAPPHRLSWIVDSFAQATALSPRGKQVIHQQIEAIANVPIETLDTAQFLAKLPAKTLIIHDRDDKEVPFAEGQAIAQAAGAEFVPTDGLGHRRILRSPDVAELVSTFMTPIRAYSATPTY